MGEGPERKTQGLFCEVEGYFREMMKTEEGGCKMQGVGIEKLQGKP